MKKKKKESSDSSGQSGLEEKWSQFLLNKAEDGGGWDQGHRSRGEESQADLEYMEVRVTGFRNKCGRGWLERGRDQA